VPIEQDAVEAAGAVVLPAPPRPSRDLVHLHPALAARYDELVAAVAPMVEASLSRAVCANRVVESSVAPPVLRLAPWRTERVAFAAGLERFASRSPCLVFTDVSECYRSVRPGIVERSLVHAGAGSVHAAAVRTFLEGLERIGVIGLPIGPDPSAVLANAVLSTVDRALAAEGYEYLRWVDDVVVAADPSATAEAVAIVGRALATVGLRPNDAKTRVVLGPDDARAAVSCARRPALVG
jgi:hypothetical protein